MTVDHVFPEDEGTGAPDGDFADAANFAALAHHDNLSDYKASGLAITPDYITPEFDLSAGKAFISDTSATGTNSGESRDQGVLYEVEVAGRTSVALTDSAVNHVFIRVNLLADDDVSLVVNTSGTPPSAPYLKIAEIDTTNDTLDETFAEAPDGLYKSLEARDMQLVAQDLSGITGVNGRIYRHDGSASITANGGSTSVEGYYVWSATDSEWKTMVAF